jgi:DNA helicase II / ATP-dependent DNA helicase PcrA
VTVNISIDEDDLQGLAARFPELDFSDAERRAVLTRMDSIDVQAVPGSGKTTLLAAKLSAIAAKWQDRYRGVCVLSHTNVARDEIERRLRMTREGTALLAYPHFIGTIQSFAHTFLALPVIRSLGISPKAIDDDYFSRKALALARQMPALRFYLDKNPNQAPKLIQSLHFSNGKLELAADVALPSKESNRFKLLEELKAKLTQEGIFRFSDMFAFANWALVNSPIMRDRICYRFPFVFIDEMQDTSQFQEDFLESIFLGRSVLQRFGDINQQIYSEEIATGRPNSFPRQSALTVSTSRRLSQQTAQVANPLKLHGADIVGKGIDSVAPPTLFLFDDSSVSHVIPQFAHYVAELFPTGTGGKAVKAVCARKSGDSKNGVGRHIRDYWPGYNPSSCKSDISADTFIATLRAARLSLPKKGHIREAVHALRGALIRLLKEAGSATSLSAKDWRGLLELVSDKEMVAVLNLVIYRLLKEPTDLTEPQQLNQLKDELFENLNPILPTELSLQRWRDIAYFGQFDLSTAHLKTEHRDTDPNLCVVGTNESAICVEIRTTALVKGETHCATLILESFRQSTYDIQEAIPIVLGDQNPNAMRKQAFPGQLRALYVAATRPTHLLCLASHVDRVQAEHLNELKRRGWAVKVVSAGGQSQTR